MGHRLAKAGSEPYTENVYSFSPPQSACSVSVWAKRDTSGSARRTAASRRRQRTRPTAIATAAHRHEQHAASSTAPQSASSTRSEPVTACRGRPRRPWGPTSGAQRWRGQQRRDPPSASSCAPGRGEGGQERSACMHVQERASRGKALPVLRVSVAVSGYIASGYAIEETQN